MALTSCGKAQVDCDEYLEYHIDYNGGDPWLILTSLAKDDSGVLVERTSRTRMAGRTIAQAIRSLCPEVDVETVRPADPSGPVIAPRAGETAINPVRWMFADLNGDDRTDTAVADFGGDRILVRLQNADGTFSDAEAFAVGASPEQLRAADLDRDGAIDVVVANAGQFPAEPGSLSILMGRGDGTFEDAAALSVSGAGTVNDVVVADLDGDGVEDLVGALYDNSGFGAVNVRLGNGDGTFRPDHTLAVPAGGRSVVVADLNTSIDAIPDIVTNGSVLLGVGNGTFQPAEQFADTFSAVLVQVADLDGDGKGDLAVAGFDHVLTVVKGNGDGTFEFPRHWLCGGSPSLLRIDDLNGDSEPDILLAHAPGTDGTRAYTADGRGGYEGSRVLPTVPDLSSRLGAYGVAAGEFTGDGILDLVVANGAEVQGSIANPLLGGTAAVLVPGLGGGDFGVPQTIVGAAGHAVVAGDWNGDGLSDVAFCGVGVQRPQVFIWLGAGDGTFAAAASIDLPGARGDGRSNTMRTALLDDDTTPDLLVVNSGTGDVSILLGDSQGGFNAAGTVTAGERPGSVAVSHLNGDAFPDLVLTWRGDARRLDGGAAVAFGHGDGTFDPPVIVRDGGAPDSVAVADFDVDGDLDIALSTEITMFDWDIEILEGNGEGMFTYAGALGLGDNLIAGISTADVDRDGRPDLAARYGGTRMVALRGLGDFSFAVVGREPLGGGTPEAIDLDADGWVDLVSASGSGFIVVGINPLTISTARPILDIAGIGQLVRLSWPGAFPEFRLARSTALDLPWIPVPEEVQQENGRLHVDVPVGSDSAFFRLERNP